MSRIGNSSWSTYVAKVVDGRFFVSRAPRLAVTWYSFVFSEMSRDLCAFWLLVLQLGYTNKVVSTMPQQPSAAAYFEFFESTMHLPMSTFVFIDETGTLSEISFIAARYL